ncbi:MAG: HAD family hydrolase [bacterium]
MKIFLDFDDVIFDTKRFIDDRDQIFLDNNIAPEIFNKYPNDYSLKRKQGELVKYSDKEHLESLRDVLDNNVDFEKLRKEISELIKDAEKYVFKEFYDFAEKIGKENLFLLSYGDVKHQTEKVKNSGIMDYFADIIITDGLKSEALSKKLLADNNEICYFIDDRITHLEDVKKQFPKIKTFLMASGDGRYKDDIKDKERIDKYCDDVVKNFAEVEKLLEQNGELKKSCV